MVERIEALMEQHGTEGALQGTPTSASSSATAPAPVGIGGDTRGYSDVGDAYMEYIKEQRAGLYEREFPPSFYREQRVKQQDEAALA